GPAPAVRRSAAATHDRVRANGNGRERGVGKSLVIGGVMGAWAKFFDSADLTPHGVCLLWRPDLLSLHVLSDSAIAFAYYSIPLALAVFVWRRRDLAFSWVFVLFAVFILGCGTTHWFEVWTLWHPDYATQGLIKGATAAASVITALLLWPLIP